MQNRLLTFGDFRHANSISNREKKQFDSLSLSLCLCLSVSLSILMAIFPGLACFTDDGSGDDNWSYKLYKAPVKSSSPSNQHPTCFQIGCPSCHPTNRVKH